jgi:hypothetical protein
LHRAPPGSVPCFPNAAVLAKAKATVGRLDAALEKARSGGELQDFNAEYRRRRRMAAAARVSFPSYPVVLARYRSALASAISGSMAPQEIMAAVFGDR